MGPRAALCSASRVVSRRMASMPPGSSRDSRTSASTAAATLNQAAPCRTRRKWIPFTGLFALLASSSGRMIQRL